MRSLQLDRCDPRDPYHIDLANSVVLRIVLTLHLSILRGMDKVSILQLKSRWPANCGTRSWRCLVVRRVAFRALSGAGLTAEYLRRRVPVAASCIGTLSAAEKRGDFSRAVGGGVVSSLPVADPSNPRRCRSG